MADFHSRGTGVDMLKESLRSVLWLVFFAAILAAWSVMYSMSIGMGLDLIGRPGPMAEAMRNMDPTMDMYMPMAQFGSLLSMWAIMMAAMMLPTMVPTLRCYEDLIRSANGSLAGWLGVLLGYSLVWLAFAVVITTLQLALLRTGLIDMLGIARTTLFSACLLITVGVFQLSRSKETCHGVCQSPISYFISRWKPGFGGGVRMGLGLGAFCVGCCWGFMALGFVGGVMSLLWMGLATFFMVLEKLPQIGNWVSRPVGAMLILGGVGLLAAAHVYEG